MKLEWKGNQKYNEDISKATIREIREPFTMNINKYVGCGNSLFFSCPELRIENADLDTEDFDMAEEKAINLLQKKIKELTDKVNRVLIKYNE